MGAFSVPSREDEAIAFDALRAMGLESLAERNINTLSGGQRQLVLIARALAMQCRILILDEPTAALDIYNQFRVLSLIRQLAREQGISILFLLTTLITHCEWRTACCYCFPNSAGCLASEMRF